MGDRFLPALTEPVIDSSSWPFLSEESINSSRYGRALADALGLTNARRLSYNSRAPPRLLPLPLDFPNTSHHLVHEGSIAATGILDFPYLNLLDWAHDDALSLPLHDVLFIVRNSSIVQRALHVGIYPITCVSWAPQSTQIAVATAKSDLLLFDAHVGRLVRTVPRGPTADYVCSMSWRDLHCLTTGRRQGLISSIDMRVPDPHQSHYSGHQSLVCGLRFAADGVQLASGDKKGVVSTWDLRHAQRCHKLQGHCGAVKALTWCPFDSEVLVTGGADKDNYIKFWDTRTGILKDTINACSEVWGLEWNMDDKALLSAHGQPCGMLVSWRYRTKFQLEKIPFVDEHGVPASITCMAATPDRRKLALAVALKETVYVWNVLRTRQPLATPKPKPSSKANSSTFARFDQIR